MKLATRLVGLLMAGVVILLVVDAFFSVRRQSTQYRTDMQRDECLLGDALRGFVENAWRTSGEQEARRLIEQANQHEHSVRIRWIPQRPINAGEQNDGGATPYPETAVSIVGAGEDGSDRMFTYVAVSPDDPSMGVLELSEPMSFLAEYNRGLVARIALLTGGLFTVSGVAVVLLGLWLVGRPLHRLADKARRVGEGDLTKPLDISRKDEMGELATAMNDMCTHLGQSRERLRLAQEQRIKALDQLRHADRLRTVGTLAAGVAHELGTPLNTIAMRSEMILQDTDANSACQRNASIVRAQTGRLSKIVQQLLTYARPSPLRKSRNDLHDILQQTLEFVRPLATNNLVELRLEASPEPAVASVDAGQFQQVVTNLIMNGIQAMAHGGTLEVELRREHAQPPAGGQNAQAGEYFHVAIRDEGQGIPEENLKHIFDPFFTTKDVGEGSGLGLSIAFGIVKEHGGWIDVQSELGKGSCFSVYLPAAPVAPATVAAGRQAN